MASLSSAEAWLARLPTPDLKARILYFPVRHHSPACAWHIEQLIASWRPETVLIEGPRDASPLLPLLTHRDLRLPVAFYTTFVQRRKKGEPPDRHAAYYPLCDYSPELAAIRSAIRSGARVQCIDLTFPEQVLARTQQSPTGRATSLLSERHLEHSRFLRAACGRLGVRDPDDLWDHLFETGFREMDTVTFMRRVLGYCALARQDYTPEMLEAEGDAAREGAMAHAIAAQEGRLLVVTGGFHTVALPDTQPRPPSSPALATEDAQIVLMRYGFEQLDRLNGYASGMPSPEFYQRVWEKSDPGELLVRFGRLCREKGWMLSIADEIESLAHVRRLAALRGHATPSREDLLDGIRSCFVKGATDMEGASVLALARKMLAGNRTGEVPEEAGQPPLVRDFRETAKALGLSLEGTGAREVALDLYRRSPHRQQSRFFHALRYLDIPFAEWRGGPDFVAGKDLERMQEHWRYCWSPAVESALIERSLYGGRLSDAALARLQEESREDEKVGLGQRADRAATRLLQACRMGLHASAPELLRAAASCLAEDSGFVSVVTALEQLLVLRVSREPLEAHELDGIPETAARAYERACYLLPGLAATAEAEEEASLDALNALFQAAQSLGDTPERKALREHRLEVLLLTTTGNSTMRGGAAGLLFAAGRLSAEGLTEALAGQLRSSREEGATGIHFLQGLLRTNRSILWQVPNILEVIHALLGTWNEEEFVRRLPLLRLGFSDLTPRECDRVAQAVAVVVGVAKLDVSGSQRFVESDLLEAVEVERLVRETLARDGQEGNDA